MQNSRGKGKTTVSSLQELGAALVPIPELPEVDWDDIEDLEAQAKKIQSAAGDVEEWTKSTLARLETMRKASRTARELAAAKITASQKALKEVLRHDTPAYRRAAWMGLFTHEFSQELRSREEAEALLERLVQEGKLIKEPSGELQAYSKAYAIAPDALFEEPEMAEVSRLLAGCLRRVYTQVGKAREGRTQGLRAQADISLEEFLNGTAGILFLDVPPEEIKNLDGSTRFWRGGGYLLVQSDGERVFPLDATGSIERVVAEMRELKPRVFLLRSSLEFEAPPFVTGLRERASKVQLLWHLINRARRTKEEAGKIEAARERFADIADVTSEAFFLQRQPGICLVEFQGIWKVPTLDGRTGQEISSLFFLLKRERIEEGTTKLRIVEAPGHLGDFFARCMDEYLEEGDKFGGMPYPLNALLQACFGQAVKAGQIANHR